MLIGLDLDNTIILYDSLFHLLAAELGLLPDKFPVNKTSIRDHLRTLPDGEETWTALQAEAYGPRIQAAQLAPGFDAFARRARAAGHGLRIVSHKTEVAASNRQYNLRSSALSWMEQQGFFSSLGFAREDVIFESTRSEKVATIERLKVDCFVDDLIEVFAEPGFPSGCRRILYAAHLDEATVREAKRYRAEMARNWPEAASLVLTTHWSGDHG